MIRTNKGELEVNGTLSELKADISVIIHGIYHTVLLKEMPEDKAKEFVFEAVERAFKSDEELEEEAKDASTGIETYLAGLLEELAKKLKGQGEE